MARIFSELLALNALNISDFCKTLYTIYCSKYYWWKQSRGSGLILQAISLIRVFCGYFVDTDSQEEQIDKKEVISRPRVDSCL